MRTTKFQKSLICAATAMAVFYSAPALAQEEASEGPVTISGNAAVTSDYRFRGLAQSAGNFAIQGGIDAAHESGFYVGTWGSSVSFSGGTEIDVFGGWSGELSSGLTADVGVVYYIYPNSGGADTDVFEGYASLAKTLGPVEAKVGANYAWGGQAALGNKENINVFGDLSAGIPNTPVTLKGHLGYSKGDSAFATLTAGDDDYVDWSLGADYSISEKLTLGVSYTDTDDKPAQKDFTDSSILFTLGVEF